MCIFIKKNGKKLVALALVPFIAINIYAGSKLVKNNESSKIESDKKESTVQMLEKKDYKQVTSVYEEVVEQKKEEIVEEKSVFEKLQQIYLSSNREVNEILESEDVTSELYASALYRKLKNAGLSDEIIKEELNNILGFSLTFTDMSEEMWNQLFGNMLGTIGKYDNVMDYYYPLAICVHTNECDLVHTGHEFDESRLTCATLEEMNANAFSEVSYSDYVIDMIMASNDKKIISQYNRIVNAGVNFDSALVELNDMYVYSQVPMCLDEDVWNETFKNLLTTVGEYDNVFEVYGDLAYYIHLLSCDLEHYTDECGVNVCEGLKLELEYK